MVQPYVIDEVGEDSLEELVDTVKRIVPKKEKSEIDNPPSYSISDYSEQHNDNMRGFDPASEDDMDDNGMSRYMDNYDEEGWD